MCSTPRGFFLLSRAFETVLHPYSQASRKENPSCHSPFLPSLRPATAGKKRDYWRLAAYLRRCESAYPEFVRTTQTPAARYPGIVPSSSPTHSTPPTANQRGTRERPRTGWGDWGRHSGKIDLVGGTANHHHAVSRARPSSSGSPHQSENSARGVNRR